MSVFLSNATLFLSVAVVVIAALQRRVADNKIVFDDQQAQIVARRSNIEFMLACLAKEE